MDFIESNRNPYKFCVSRFKHRPNSRFVSEILQVRAFFAFCRLKAIRWTCIRLAYLVVRVLEASDRALERANLLQIVEADFHSVRHLVVEAEVMVGLDDREVLLAFRRAAIRKTFRNDSIVCRFDDGSGCAINCESEVFCKATASRYTGMTCT